MGDPQSSAIKRYQDFHAVASDPRLSDHIKTLSRRRALYILNGVQFLSAQIKASLNKDDPAYVPAPLEPFADEFEVLEFCASLRRQWEDPTQS